MPVGPTKAVIRWVLCWWALGPHLHFQVTYKGDMGTTALSNSVNPSAFFSETLIPDSGCDVPAYGQDYNYATGEFDN